MKCVIKVYLKQSTFILFTLLLLQCNNEDIIIEEAQQNNVETIAPSIALNEINTNPSFKNNFNRASKASLFDKIDLTKDAKKYTAEDREIHYTFALKNVNNSTNARSSDYQYTTDNLNIKLNPDGSQIISIFRYIPDMSWFNNPSNDITSYTGQIQVLNESLDIISIFNLVDAQVIEAEAASRGIGSRSTDSCSLELREICTELIHSGGFTTGLYCEVIITTNCVGGGKEEGTVNDGNTGGTNENPTGTSGSGDGDTTSGTAILDTCLETNTCEEDKITNELIGEEDCIFNKLKDFNLFKSTIKKFEDSGTLNLTLKYGDCDNASQEACTSARDIENGNITILFQTRVNSNPLNFAAIILHEGIHAELFKYIHEYGIGVDQSDRRNLLAYYFQAKAIVDPRYVDSWAQHQHMADNYVKPIAQAIRQLDNNRYSLDYYMGFGWDGLRQYGYDGYFDNGNWVSLDKGESTEYYRKQKTVVDNTELRSDDCD